MLRKNAPVPVFGGVAVTAFLASLVGGCPHCLRLRSTVKAGSLFFFRSSGGRDQTRKRTRGRSPSRVAFFSLPVWLPSSETGTGYTLTNVPPVSTQVRLKQRANQRAFPTWESPPRGEARSAFYRIDRRRGLAEDERSEPHANPKRRSLLFLSPSFWLLFLRLSLFPCAPKTGHA